MHFAEVMHAHSTLVIVVGSSLLAVGCGGVPFESGGFSSVDASTDGPADDGSTAGDATALPDAEPTTRDAGTMPAPSVFSCGQGTCSAPGEYCFVPASLSRQPACRSVPSACEPMPTCACIEQRDAQCASPSCSSDGSAITLTCKL